MDQQDDLKAFERRMIEIVSSLHPSIWRWRVILLILILVTLVTFYALMTDDSSTSPTAVDLASSETASLSSIYSKLFHKRIYFSVALSLLLFAFLFGIHRKMFASSIIIARFRLILADYNMSCDTDGRLILRPRPNSYLSGSS